MASSDEQNEGRDEEPGGMGRGEYCEGRSIVSATRGGEPLFHGRFGASAGAIRQACRMHQRCRDRPRYYRHRPPSVERAIGRPATVTELSGENIQEREFLFSAEIGTGHS